MTFAGVNEYEYCGKVYAIEVNKELAVPETTFDGEKYMVRVPAEGTWYVTAEGRVIGA
jgi:hypothetical protein